jgi:hypothetical protein
MVDLAPLDHDAERHAEPAFHASLALLSLPQDDRMAGKSNRLLPARISPALWGGDRQSCASPHSASAFKLACKLRCGHEKTATLQLASQQRRERGGRSNG